MSFSVYGGRRGEDRSLILQGGWRYLNFVVKLGGSVLHRQKEVGLKTPQTFLHEIFSILSQLDKGTKSHI